MDVALFGQRSDQLEEPTPGEQREAEEQQPFRQIEDQLAAGDPLQQRGPALGWAGRPHLLADPTPELGLPARMLDKRSPGSVDILPCRPRPHHGRSMEVVAVEHVGHPASRRVPGCPRG